jgi:AcrR family transcriptional regulator
MGESRATAHASRKTSGNPCASRFYRGEGIRAAWLRRRPYRQYRKRCRFLKGAFYSNFLSKEELILAVLDLAIVTPMHLPLRATASAGRNRHCLVNAIVDQTRDRERDRLAVMLRLELLRQCMQDLRLRAAMAGHCNDLLAANARLFVRARTRLRLRPLPEAARSIAELYLAAMLGIGLLTLAGVKLSPVGDLATLLLNTVVAENPMALAKGKAKRARCKPCPTR